jgi:HisJ family histidinol phosphate phosphatase
MTAEDPRIAALPDIHGHAKGEHKPFVEERPIPYTARMLFLWFFHACRRGSPRFLMVTDHINYLTFEDPAAVNLVRRALKLAAAGDLYGAAETAGVDLGHAAVVSEGLRKGMRYSIGAEVDNDPRSRPDAQNIVDAMRPDGMLRSIHFLPITHPVHGENWMWPFDNPEFRELYETVGVEQTWELYMAALLDAIDKLPGQIVAHFYVPAKFGHWPAEEALERYEDQLVAACAERGVAIELNSRYFYKYFADDEAQLQRYRDVNLRLLRKAKEKGVAIAVGSDAHSPRDQGSAFSEVLALLDAAEINEIAFPINGRLARVALRATEEIIRKRSAQATQAAGSSVSGFGRGEGAAGGRNGGPTSEEESGGELVSAVPARERRSHASAAAPAVQSEPENHAGLDVAFETQALEGAVPASEPESSPAPAARPPRIKRPKPLKAEAAEPAARVATADASSAPEEPARTKAARSKSARAKASKLEAAPSEAEREPLAQAELVQAEPAQPELAQPELAQPEPVRPEPAQATEPEAGQTEAAGPEAGQAEAAEPEAGQAEAGGPEAGQAEAEAEAAEPEAGQAEAEAAEPEAGQAEAAEPEAGEAPSPEAEAVQVESAPPLSEPVAGSQAEAPGERPEPEPLQAETAASGEPEEAPLQPAGSHDARPQPARAARLEAQTAADEAPKPPRRKPARAKAAPKAAAEKSAAGKTASGKITVPKAVTPKSATPKPAAKPAAAKKSPAAKKSVAKKAAARPAAAKARPAAKKAAPARKPAAKRSLALAKRAPAVKKSAAKKAPAKKKTPKTKR